MASEKKRPNGPVLACETSDDGAILKFRWQDGEEFTLAPESLAQDIKTQALLHGLRQKLVDTTAIAKDPETGLSASLAFKKQKFLECFYRIQGLDQDGQTPIEPTWNKERGGEGSGDSSGLLYRALVRFYGGKASPEAIKAQIAKFSKAEQAALRASPKIKPIIEEIKREDEEKRVTDKSAGDALQAKLDALLLGDADDSDTSDDLDEDAPM